MAELFGSGAFTAISASPPPRATPRFVVLPTLLTQPPQIRPKMPQLSGCPSYLNGKVPLEFGAPSIDGDQRPEVHASGHAADGFDVNRSLRIDTIVRRLSR